MVISFHEYVSYKEDRLNCKWKNYNNQDHDLRLIFDKSYIISNDPNTEFICFKYTWKSFN